MSRIVSLQVENFKRIVAVFIEPTRNLVRLVGDNEQGKSSVLDAILAGLGGKTAEPSMPIRVGQEVAKIRIAIGDKDVELIAEKRFTTKGSYLDVRTAKYDGTPQAVLDGLVGPIAFDPMQFIRLDAAQQGSMLRSLIGLDFSKIDQDRQRLFDDRTAISRDGKAEVARLEGMLKPDDAPDNEIEPDSLREELNDARKIEQRFHEYRHDVKVQEQIIDRLTGELEQKREHLHALRNRVMETEEAISEISSELSKNEAFLEGLQSKPAPEAPDVQSLLDRVASVNRTNELVRQKRARIQQEAHVEALRQERDHKTVAIEELDRLKIRMLREAQYPVDGLGLTEDGIVTLDGLPLEQASTSQKLKVGATIAAKLNPNLRVTLIRDGSLLDQRSMEWLEEWAESENMQVWIELVGRSTEGEFIIEDGAVQGVAIEAKSAKPKKAAK